jgi:hypothetical protein
MIVIRLIPVFISTLLFAAHVMRIHGSFWAIPVIALLLTFIIRKPRIIRFWQFFMALATI